MGNDIKRLSALAAAHILGKKTNIKLTGSKKKVMATRNVINASRNLYEAMNRQEPRLDEVKLCLQKKQDAAKEFKVEFGHSWPL
tara:strand:+ start:20185 stop:20436 length:252 start_codon:yes stop_codon:yes gene_type:complete